MTTPALSAEEMADTYEMPKHGWTCFHCGETFTTVGAARDHFGGDILCEPGCMIRVQLGEERGLLMALRKAEAALERYRAEDSDADRQYHALVADHAVALRRAEEKGYERGLEDGRSPAPVDRQSEGEVIAHKLDTARQVFFYEQEFYVLSNFSAFRLQWGGRYFDTSEHAYHYEKFSGQPVLQENVKTSRSAHDAFKTAETCKASRRADWDDVKVGIMRNILRAKASQHEYVRRKLLETGDRELIEDSWRDPFWGWGPKRDGQNMLGKLWMEIRAEYRALTP